MDCKKLKLFCRQFGPSFGKSVLVVAGLIGSVADAVEPTIYQLGDGGAIAPHVRVEMGNDNNPLRADAGSQETLYLRLQPSATYLVQRRNNRLSFGYSGDYFQYFEEYCQGQTGVVRPGDCLQGSPTFDKASFQDHTLSLNGFLEVSKRMRARLNVAQEIAHQPLGTGLSSSRGVLDALTTPDYWNRRTARASLSYGAFQARGEVRLGIALADRELNTKRSGVNLDAQSDTSVGPFGQILYRVGTRTQLFAGIGFAEVRDSISFNDAGQEIENLERDISRFSFGAELDSGSVTSGSISVSSVREDFLSRNTDLEYLSWDVDLTWRPRRFSTITLSGGRETEGSFFDNEISLTTNLGANWVHFWRERFSTRLEVDFEINENVDRFSDLNGAEDTTTLFRFEGNYNVRRWLDIGGFVVIDTRAGSSDQRDYERTLIGVTANGTI